MSFTRRFKRSLAFLSILIWAHLDLTAAYAFADQPALVKSTPDSFQATSADVDGMELVTGEEAARLFDRNINTSYTAPGSAQVEVHFDKVQTVSEIRIHGSASYLLTVQQQRNGQWHDITGFIDLDLNLLAEQWQRLQLPQFAETDMLRLQLVATADVGHIDGLDEIEIWSLGELVPVQSGRSLLALMDDGVDCQQGRRYTAQPQEGIIGPPEGEFVDLEYDNTFTFDLAYRPDQIKRAWLSYTLSGLAHWTSAIRSINDQPAMGGYVVEQGEGGRQIEAISPRWLLQGENRIRFVPLSENERYVVRDVQVLIELDNGANFVSYIKSNLSDDPSAVAGLYDGDTTTGLALVMQPDQLLRTGWTRRPWQDLDAPEAVDQPVIELGFDRLTDLSGVSFYASRELQGPVGIAFLKDGLWIPSQAVVEPGPEAGWYALRIEDGQDTQAVRLYFDTSADSDAVIGEVRVQGSNLGGNDVPDIVVSYPDSGQYFGDQVYLRGYVSPADNGSGQAALFVGDQQIGHINGEFETMVDASMTGQDSGVSGAGGSGGCFIEDIITLPLNADRTQIEIRAVYPDGETAVSIVSLLEDRLVTNNGIELRIDGIAGAQDGLPGRKNGRPWNDVNLTKQFDVRPDKASKHDFAGAGLQIGKGSVRKALRLSMMTLRDRDLPALDPGMVNVTGMYQGYRFLPHGMKFDQKIEIKLPYARQLLPAGFKEEDIHTYFYDRASGRWVLLERDSIDADTSQVVSLTDHFTDMINAVVQAPESPQSTSFNPTQMKDIKAANPAAGVNLIEPPQANNQGDARLSYPIEVPPGRRGLQPQLAVQYNSTGGNGWLGLGWDLPMQAVSIDTRWGVPRYDKGELDPARGPLETETYLLNGQQLTPVAHRGALVPRSSEKIFHTRVEGAFQKIIRHGNGPANYWWEVIDKNGTHYYYGGEPATHGPAADSTLVEGRGRIAKWALRLVRDSNGNTMRYECVRQADSGFVDSEGKAFGNRVLGYELYLQRINYTGHVTHGDKEGSYQVVFTRDRQLGEPRRPDVSIDARLRFKKVTADLLRKIEVKYKGQMVRSYELTYKKGAFEKTLLEAITQRDSQGQVFNRHKFDYFDDARISPEQYKGFGAPETWNSRDDDEHVGLLNIDAGRASALGGSSSRKGGGHLYLGFNPSEASKDNSVGGKIGFSHSESKGLLTLTDLNGDGLPDKVFRSGGKFRANLSGPGGSPGFNERADDIGLGKISSESSNMISAGVEAYFFGSMGINWNWTFTKSSAYLSDVNGDGLTDLVDGRTVLFGRPQDPSQAHPKPLYGTDPSQTPYPVGPGAVNAENLLEDLKDVYQQMLEASPLHDTLRRWVAPWSGRIRIGGDAALLEDTSADRAKYETADGVRVAIQHNGSELWAQTIEATDYSPKSPDVQPSIKVDAGDRIYFRIQSRFDGAYDQVHWNPTITYLNVQPATDIDGRDPYRYQAGRDFIATGRSNIFTTLPAAGTVHLDGAVEKLGPTSDDVRVRVVLNDQEVFSHTMGFDLADSAAVDLAVNVAQQDKLKLLIEADSPIDMAKIRWRPHLEYTAIEGHDSAYDHEGKPILAVDPPYAADVYGANDLSAPQPVWTAPESGVATVGASITSNAQSGVVVLTVKRLNELVAKASLDIAAARQADPDGPLALSAQAQIEQDDQLVFELSTRDRLLAQFIRGYGISVQYESDSDPEPVTIPVPGALYYPAEEALFAQPFRGWGCAGYRGEGERAEQPVVEEDLVLPAFDEERYNQNRNVSDPNDLNPQTTPQSQTAILFFPQPAQERWRGYDDGSWLAAETASSSRLGADDISVPKSDTYAGARAVQRLSKSFQTGLMGGFVASGSYTTGYSRGLLDFIDMNGDRFPDVVSDGHIQYSPMTGGLIDAGQEDNDGIRQSGTQAWSAGLGGTFAQIVALVSGNAKNSGQQMPPFGLSGGFGRSEDIRDFDLMDINGDGLPDKVYDGGHVSLNLGYGFDDQEDWGAGQVSKGRSNNENLGAGYNNGTYEYGGGVSLAQSTQTSDGAFADINGDGLADYVQEGIGGLKVALNTGSTFVPLTYPGAGDFSRHVSSDQSGGGYFTFGIALCEAACYLIINPGFDMGNGMSRPETQLMDIDGDGYADYLQSNKDSEIHVRRNTIGRTNLLQRVVRPLGAAFDLEYTRDGNTYQMPQSRWTLSKVKVDDGFAGDGVDTQVTTFTYQGGFYHRREREFYGYATVTSAQRDASKGDAVYRTTIQTFNNDNYYEKGLLLCEVVQDAAGHKYLQTDNTYQLRDVASGKILQGPFKQSLTATAFPELVRTDKKFYEGQAQPGLSTYQTFAYDGLGNVTHFFDAAGSGAADDIESAIEYHHDENAYIMGKANKITVKGNGTLLRQRTAEIQKNTGNVTRVSRSLSGTDAVHDMAYDVYGNIIRQTGPANDKDQRYELAYKYDDALNTYVVRIEDSFHYISTADYNPLWGQIQKSTDINGQTINYAYDAKGRLASVTGPYQNGLDRPTISFAYHPEASVPWALTRHFDNYQQSGDPLETVLFIDGLKRVLQTKKDGAIGSAGTAAAQDRMIVSGRVLFDHVGRTVAQYYPVTEPLGRQGQFNSTFDSIQPTRTSYDVLDRALVTTIPDNTRTQISYGFGPDRDGQKRFETTVIDANNKTKVTYRDVRDLITAIKESNNGKALWTSYRYDGLKQILEVIDANGNPTEAKYDLLGRRIRIKSPDAGLTEYVYDRASNLTRKITANLRSQGKAIEYDYTFNRLDAIHYPDFAENDVTYTYGAPQAPFNRAGRIVTVTDESGLEERFYGPLGETVKIIKTVTSSTQGKNPHGPEIYVTEYTYDTYNRLRQLIYPDGETLTYHYNSGGLADKVSGQKGSYSYPYLKALTYDKFEQRLYMRQGNNAETNYSYNPLSRRLSGLKAAAAGTGFMDLSYGYDNVGNILSLENKAGAASDAAFGGRTKYSFGYDDLYRLTDSTGSWRQPDTEHSYTLAMVYDEIHNIVSKTQSDMRLSDEGDWIRQHKTTYDFVYAYGSSRPHAPTHIGERSFTYDANGNQTGWTSDNSGTRRIITWDEENRIQSIEDNGHLMTYKYNDAGERVFKTGPHGETVYLNQFFSVSNREGGSKHVFVGTSRIATKLVKGQENVTTPGHSDPPGNAWGHTGNNGGGSGGGAPGNGAIIYEPDVFYYHPDHLGSTSFVTDLEGKVYQHLEYFPFGETWVEEVSDRWRVPYLFTAKELDRETGLYYFGARYYDPRTSVWQSTDPALEGFLPKADKKVEFVMPSFEDWNVRYDLPGMGGVFANGNLNLYSYVQNNPLNAIDPFGLELYNIAIKGADFNPYGHNLTLHIDDKTKKATYFEVTGPDSKHANVFKRSEKDFIDHYKGRIPELSNKNFKPTTSIGSDYDVVKVQGVDEKKVLDHLNKMHQKYKKGSDNYPYEWNINNCTTFSYRAYKAGGKEFSPKPHDTGEAPWVWPRDLNQAIRYHSNQKKP